MRTLRHAIFDLDGTLVDSLPGITWSVEQALAACALPPLSTTQWFSADAQPLADTRGLVQSRDGNGAVADNRTRSLDRSTSLRPLIGPPIRSILATVSGLAEGDKLDRLERAFRLSYDSEGYLRTVCFDGVPDLLWTLLTGGTRMWIVTNKPTTATRAILQHLKLGGFFEEVVCRDGRTPAYVSKAEALQDLLERRSISRAESLLIGDTLEDCHAAVAAGIPCALAAHGYGALDRPLPGCYRISAWTELLDAIRDPSHVGALALQELPYYEPVEVLTDDRP